MDDVLYPNEKELQVLKSQLQEKKKQEEYEKLKKDIYDMSIKANHELTEYQGGLKEAEAERPLKNKGRKFYFADIILAHFIKMLTPRPVARNILAIGIIFGAVFVLINFLNISHVKELKQFPGLKTYLIHFVEVAGAIQILKSATRSLLLPLIATVVGVIVSSTISDKHLVLMHSQIFFQILMCVGVMGLTISAFTID